MNTNNELRTGNWLLVVGSRAICPTLLALTARLAEAGPVRVVDGGNQYNVYPVMRAARGRLEVRERIRVSRAFTCYQMLACWKACRPDRRRSWCSTCWLEVREKPL